MRGRGEWGSLPECRCELPVRSNSEKEAAIRVDLLAAKVGIMKPAAAHGMGVGTDQGGACSERHEDRPVERFIQRA